MADHLNVVGTVETYCLNERAFVHCEGKCETCPSFIGRKIADRGGLVCHMLTPGYEMLIDEIRYHSRCAYQNAKLDIKKVIFNDPATIVFWTDGTKTVVKVHDEPFDQEKGIAMALVKKMQLAKRFRVIVQEPKVKKPKPKSEPKRETWREKAARERPDAIDDSGAATGGVWGCPGGYFPGGPTLFSKECKRACAITDETCRKCWDQEVIE